MKLVLFLLFIYQSVFALGLSDFILDMTVDDAPDLCKKYAKIDQPKCLEFIRGKRFRKEFLSVCFEVHKKMGPENSYSCLESIADKSTVSASRKQAEVCKEIIPSGNFTWVKRCIDSNVITELANICGRYIENKNKAYKATTDCIYTVDTLTLVELDSSTYKGCLLIKDTKNFVQMADCLSNAERKKSELGGGTPRVEDRFKESATQQ